MIEDDICDSCGSSDRPTLILCDVCQEVGARNFDPELLEALKEAAAELSHLAAGCDPIHRRLAVVIAKASGTAP